MGSKFKFIDLFAGIGGLRLPFDEMGVCVFTSEKNPSARKVYADNFSEHEHLIDRDVSGLVPVSRNFPDHDLLLAGFPCQPFSHAGHKKGFEDIRGTLFFSIAAIAKAKKPRVILLENVRGLKGHDNGFTFLRIKETLEDLGYVFHWKVLNARDFGLPQNRNRIFMVCIRKDIPGAQEYEFPEPTHDREALRVGDFLDSRVSTKYTISDRLWEGHQRRKAANVASGKGFGYQLFNRQSRYVATISARYYKDGSEALVAQKNKNPRKLTPREAGRLQGFPDSFTLPKSDVEAYKQFGNAVPINVVDAVAKTLFPYLA